MQNKQLERKRRIDAMARAINMNKDKDKRTLIANFCFQFGASEKIVNEYWKILEDSGQINREEKDD
jgi:hypothetical protein